MQGDDAQSALIISALIPPSTVIACRGTKAAPISNPAAAAIFEAPDRAHRVLVAVLFCGALAWTDGVDEC
jgi:hypothetical protein